jgi:hypothetical protein
VPQRTLNTSHAVDAPGFSYHGAYRLVRTNPGPGIPGPVPTQSPCNTLQHACGCLHSWPCSRCSCGTPCCRWSNFFGGVVTRGHSHHNKSQSCNAALPTRITLRGCTKENSHTMVNSLCSEGQVTLPGQNSNHHVNKSRARCRHAKGARYHSQWSHCSAHCDWQSEMLRI